MVASPMSLLLENGWVCTVDDAGTELPDGWVLVRDGLVETVGGDAPAHLVNADESEIAREHRVQAQRLS